VWLRAAGKEVWLRAAGKMAGKAVDLDRLDANT
jgi:hypothetical protein